MGRWDDPDDGTDGTVIPCPVDPADPDAAAILFQRKLLRDLGSMIHPKREPGRAFGIHREYPDEPLFWNDDYGRKLSRREFFNHHARLLWIVSHSETRDA